MQRSYTVELRIYLLNGQHRPRWIALYVRLFRSRKSSAFLGELGSQSKHAAHGALLAFGVVSKPICESRSHWGQALALSISYRSMPTTTTTLKRRAEKRIEENDRQGWRWAWLVLLSLSRSCHWKKRPEKGGKAINALVFIDCRRYPAPLSADHSPIFFNWSRAHPLQHGDSHQRSSRFRHIMYRWVTYFFRHTPHQTTTYRIILKKKNKQTTDFT